ncbi:MAG: hypothetical protein WAP49_07795 [Mycobacterium sp.]|jgi:hypothetical protein
MNLTVKTMVTACVVATAATLGLAAPAQANPSLLNGTYDIDGGDQDAYWTASSTCATDGCVARIVSNVGWSGNAVMNNGRWNLTVTKPDGVVCSDGSYAPVVIAYSVDAVSGAGTVTADSNGDCPGGQITAAQFQIKKISDF